MPLTPAPPLGFGLVGPALEVASFDLDAVELVLAVTDGVLERRDEVIDTGYERLASVLAGASGAEDAAARVAAYLEVDRPDDDALFAAVAVR